MPDRVSKASVRFTEMMIGFLDRITYWWAVVVVVFVALSLFGAVAYVVASVLSRP
jgi:hypothetical protein